MPLPRLQSSIVHKLQEMGQLTEDQANRLYDSPDDITGEAMDKILREEYKISEFSLLTAKARAFELYPINSKHLRPSSNTFEKLEKDFCRENKIFPLGVVGDHIAIVITDPFNLSVANRVAELTKLKVSLLLALRRVWRGC